MDEDDMDLGDINIFDAATSKKIKEEHLKDMEDAERAIGSRRMGLIAGYAKDSTTAKATGTPAGRVLTAGGNLLNRLASATPFLSGRKTRAPTPAAESTSAPTPAEATSETPVPVVASTPAAQVAPESTATSVQPSIAATPEQQPAAAEDGNPATRRLIKRQEKTPAKPATADIDAGKKHTPVRTSGAADAAESATTVESVLAKRFDAEGKRAAEPTSSAPTIAPSLTANTALSSGAARPNTASEAVVPELKVISFDVREPSLGAFVVGHVAILEGSCYVWAATEGSSAQGSLSAAVGTRFDGGMPTATPLLAGEGVGEAGAAGGVCVSMAQRLCIRTGRVVFVSCDLSEDSQILVAAVESKVVALLKAEG